MRGADAAPAHGQVADGQEHEQQPSGDGQARGRRAEQVVPAGVVTQEVAGRTELSQRHVARYDVGSPGRRRPGRRYGGDGRAGGEPDQQREQDGKVPPLLCLSNGRSHILINPETAAVVPSIGVSPADSAAGSLSAAGWQRGHGPCARQQP
jgi:hypothetical protein